MGAGEASIRAGGLLLSWARLRDQIARRTRRDDAEDLLHDAWIGLAERQVVANNPAALLARAAANRGYDAWRRERRVATGAAIDLAADAVADHRPLQDEALIARHRLERLRAGVEHLSPRTCQIFLMHRLDGRKYREIAEELDISQMCRGETCGARDVASDRLDGELVT